MADEKKTESNGLTGAVPITAVLALLASFAMFTPSPFHDDRPPGNPLKLQQYEAAQDINARLWQDPFEAVDNKDDIHKPEQIYKGNPINPDEDQVTVIAVTLPGSPYQEAAESRMRWRYAVLSALANQMYNPVDEQHIGYFEASIPNKEKPSNSNSTLPTKIAFEWWSKDKDEHKDKDKDKKVLLLWINESSLRKNPAATLKDILSRTIPDNETLNKLTNSDIAVASLDSNVIALANIRKEDSDNKNAAEFNYAVLGPNSSTLLEDLLKEVKDNKDNELGKINTKPITYYSAAATADEGLLLKVLPKEDVDHQTVQAYLRHGITFYRTTSTDAEMMQAMANELATLHRIQKTDHIVILSEWDTLYGRSISKAFKSAWALKNNLQDPDQVISRFSYMRGLDGKLPDKSEKADKSEKEADSAEKKSDTKEPDKSESAKALELPEGRNQKDYLRRLSEYIRDLDQKIIDEGDSKGITVIGVLGSDVRDKFMILEALRPYFKHKLFFTTDLDAAYYHPTKWHQTHNMLVASAFDLKLRPELQGTIPPFRDTYQTALFLATQMLVNNIEITEQKPMTLAQTDEKKQFINTPSPLLFEIGRHSPIRLKLNNDIGETEPNNPKCTWQDVEGECKNTVQPPFVNPKSNLTNNNVVLQILSLTVGIGFLCFVSSWFRRRVKFAYLKCKHQPWYIVGALIVCIVFWKMWEYMTQVSTEPFYWLEGVSVWPSEILRFFAILFAVTFFCWGKKRIKKEYLKDDLISKLSPPPVNSNPLKIRDVFSVFFIGNWKQVSTTHYRLKVFPNEIWVRYTEYFEWNRPKKSSCWVWRIIIHVLVFFAAALLLICQTGMPNVPARDDFAFNANLVIIGIAIFSTLFLTIWVVENARLCKKLIEHLSINPSEWHAEAIAWATKEKCIAVDCVNEWLDIYLVTQLTKIMQPLIWGPIGCIALMLLARSPVTDNWDLPWGLEIIFVFILCYAISAEVFLQRGAQQARTKAVDQLTDKIRNKRNEGEKNEWDIKRIEVEIERIKDLREGAFLPWYQLPVLQSFGGLSSLWLALQYITNLLENGSLGH